MDYEGGGQYEEPVPDDANDYHILVIEQDEDVSRRGTSILSEAGYQVTQIQIPEVALSMIQQQPKLFDLVLVGLPLQGATDPITFLRNILTVNQDICVLLMGTNPDLNFTLTALHSGATLVLDKPVKRFTLRSFWQHVFCKRTIAEKRRQRENNVHTSSNAANVSLHPSRNDGERVIWKREITCYERHGKSTISTPYRNWLERDEQVMRLPLALGYNSTAFFGSAMGGDQNHNEGPRDAASSVNRAVVVDEESSSNDREKMIREEYGFTLDEHLAEPKNGDGAQRNATCGKDHKP